MRVEMQINSFHVNMDIKTDFKSRTDIFYDNNGKSAWVLVNLEAGMCQIGGMQSYDGGLTYHWNMMNNYAIRESKQGLQYFDSYGSMGWKYFDDAVQEAFAQFALEKEIK